jgi:TolA-binding protein
MRAVDLHPEDLLEREVHGELSETEQERLEQHARQCAVCRLERQAREDFRRDSESAEAEADVARLLAAMAGPLALTVPNGAPKRSPMRYLRFASAAAAVVTMTGLAAAARWQGVREVVMPWTVAAQQSAPVVPPTATPRSTPRVAAVAAVPSPAAEVPAVEPATMTPSPLPEAQLPSQPPVPAQTAAPARRVRSMAATAAMPASRADGDDATADAASFFRRANEARQSGDHFKAGELYGLLMNRFPSSPETHASLALFGRMLLDDGNANGALQCFDDYLRKGGVLREEVMLGRALAFQRIGPRASSDEARAWTSLIDAYPGSVHAERARRRLSELARL